MENNENIIRCLKLLIEQGFDSEERLFLKIFDAVQSYLRGKDPKLLQSYLGEKGSKLPTDINHEEIFLEDGEIADKGTLNIKGEILEKQETAHDTKEHFSPQEKKSTVLIKKRRAHKKTEKSQSKTNKTEIQRIIADTNHIKDTDRKEIRAQPLPGLFLRKCEYCDYTVDDNEKRSKYFMSKLRQHQRVQHNVCEICRKLHLTADDMNIHIESVHRDGDGVIVCGVEGCTTKPQRFKKGSRFSAAAAHVRVIHDKLSYLCRDCGKPYRWLRTHNKLYHSKDPQSLQHCDKCQFASLTVAKMKRHHRLLHPKIEPGSVTKIVSKLRCDLCSFETNGLSQDEIFKLIVHKKIHQDGEMLCHLCHYKSKKPFTLKRHLAEEHSIGAIFKCNICDYKTGGQSGRSHLRDHIARHTKEQSFLCDKCDFTSYVKSTLDVHMKRHEGNPKYLCHECDYKSHDFGNFTCHQQAKHGSVVLKCEDCDFATKSRRSMREHKRKHSTCLTCSMCGFSTNSQQSLRVHKTLNH